MTPAPRPPGHPRRALVAASLLPGLAAGAALLAGWLAGGTAVAEAAGFASPTPRSLTGLLVVLAAVALAAQGAVVVRLRRRDGELRRSLERLAVTDETTGARTRRYVLDRLADELARARRYGRCVSVALLDLDGFSRVNATVGVDGGDAVLRGFAAAVKLQLRRSDVVGRLRDDELLVVLPETDEAGARVIAERLRLAVSSLAVLHAGITLQATASVGVATYAHGLEAEAPEAEALLRRADEALFQAKSAGRNRIA